MRVTIGPYPKYNKKTKTYSKRVVKVKIDPYDTWSMDNTLAHIIHPMLIQLKATKHGAPNAADADVPENLRSTNAPPRENDWDPDENHFKRWDWILDEMIWAFAQVLDDGDAEAQFYTGEADWLWQPCDQDGNPLGEATAIGDNSVDAPLHWMVKGPKHTLVRDEDGIRAYYARIANGLRLFGVYFQALWD